jgi:hypothetical protein
MPSYLVQLSTHSLDTKFKQVLTGSALLLVDGVAFGCLTVMDLDTVSSCRDTSVRVTGVTLGAGEVNT